jgi:hypothetical protein
VEVGGLWAFGLNAGCVRKLPAFPKSGRIPAEQFAG